MSKVVTEIDETFDFGFTAISSEEIAKEHSADDRLTAIYKLVNPLIQNLLKDADTKDMIKWPNRKDQLIKFQRRLKELTKQP
jgi:hypothetical protein